MIPLDSTFDFPDLRKHFGFRREGEKGKRKGETLNGGGGERSYNIFLSVGVSNWIQKKKRICERKSERNMKGKKIND